MKNTINEIRQQFLCFFSEKKHIVFPSSPLVPNNDSTLLFTNAGMNQFKNFFLNNQKNDFHARVTTAQHCLRTGGKHNDLENVGYTERHHTFFEMLGNFSFGDYFKIEAIMYAWELLTSKKWFNINKEKLWISVYQNDEETYKIWRDIIKIPDKKIIKIGDKNNIKYYSDNFWQMGDTGPCGPCTEIFYQNNNNYEINNTKDFINNQNNSFLEIWNIVFIEFNRISDKEIIPLSHKSIDTGMGLERIASVLQNVNSNYKIDIFQKIINTISSFGNIKKMNNISLKIISDHIRSCALLINENITPSNEHRGYILRRIIRRTIRHAHKIGIKKNFFHKIIPDLIDIISDSYNFLKKKSKIIQKIIKNEEIQFSQTLEKGLKILKKQIKNTSNNIISGKIAFYLYDTFGFPIDLSSEICREKNIKIDFNSYNVAKLEQKKKSNIKKNFYKNYNEDIIINDSCIFDGYKKNKIQSLVKYIFVKNISTNSISKNESGILFLEKTCFYPESGGQIGDKGKLYFKKSQFIVENTKKFGNTIGHIGKMISGKIIKNNLIYAKIDKNSRHAIQLNHSATHLLHATLRNVLGNDVFQKGSLVNHQYLRFDFSYKKNINISKIKDIENIINNSIRDNYLIKSQNLTLEEAKKKKAIGLFNNKYDNIVRMVYIKNISSELCIGTHTNRTGNIGLFKIKEQYSIASGIQRIEAVTGKKAIEYIQNQYFSMKDISFLLKSNNSNIKEVIKKTILKTKQLEKKINVLQNKENAYQIKKMLKNINNINGIQLSINLLNNYDAKSFKMIMERLKKKLKNAIIISINQTNNNYTIIIRVTKNLTNYITAIKIINIFIQETGGKGGGKKEIAEGNSNNINKLNTFLNNIKVWTIKKIKKINI